MGNILINLFINFALKKMHLWLQKKKKNERKDGSN